VVEKGKKRWDLKVPKAAKLMARPRDDGSGGKLFVEILG